MDEIKLKLENGKGAFLFIRDGEQLGKMEITIKEDLLTIYHTEVLPKAGGHGLASRLIDAMAEYARQNKLKVIPLCPYVIDQFRQHQDQYADIWKAS